MKTYLAKNGEIERKHIVVDAAGIPLGRLAVKIANSLRGKDRPTYTPHVDTGCFVILPEPAAMRTLALADFLRPVAQISLTDAFINSTP